MAYKKPTPYVKVGDVVLTNVGQEVELVSRTTTVDVRDEDGIRTGEKVLGPNPLFSKYSNASSRAKLKNGQRIRVLFEIDGVVDTVNPAAIGTALCGVTERQSFYVRVRQEPPQASAPSDPGETP